MNSLYVLLFGFLLSISFYLESIVTAYTIIVFMKIYLVLLFPVIYQLLKSYENIVTKYFNKMVKCIFFKTIFNKHLPSHYQ